MTRNVTTTFRRSAEASFADEVFLCFLTIAHDSLDDPIRVNWDTVDHAYAGYNFIGFPFEITILSDDENPPVAQLTIQNIDPRIGDSIRLLNSPPRIKIEVVSSADFVGPLLAHFNGTDGSTTFINDGSAIPNPTLTAVGNAQLNSNALLLDGSGDYVQAGASSAFAIGAADFTVSFKFSTPVAAITSDYVFYDSGGSQYKIWMVPASFAVITDEASANILDETNDPLYDESLQALAVLIGGVNVIRSNTTIQADTTYSVIMTRSSGILRLFLDSVQQGDDYIDATNLTDNDPTIGANAVGGEGLNGRIDEFNIDTGTPTVIYSADKLFLINVSVDIMQVTGQIVGWDYLQRVWPGPRAQQSVFPGLFR